MKRFFSAFVLALLLASTCFAAVKYLEIEEQLTPGEKIERLPTIMRIIVEDEDDARSQKDALTATYFNGTSVKQQLHKHNHELTGNNLPCEIIDLTKEKSLGIDEIAIEK